MATKGEIKRGVHNGAVLLDTHVPDWFTKIDLYTLNQAEGEHCVLAQTFSTSYVTGLNILRDKSGHSIGYPVYYQFRSDNEKNYVEATGFWRREVEARRNSETSQNVVRAAASTGLSRAQIENAKQIICEVASNENFIAGIDDGDALKRIAEALGISLVSS